MTKITDRSNEFFIRHRGILVCLLLITATFAVYWQVHSYGFIELDDNQYVTENRYVRNGLTLESISWAFTTLQAGNWHPLTWLSHMLDCQFFGLNPGRHHLASLFIHIINAVLLFYVLRKMTGGFWQSAFVAALFALHPLHVESVAWASERKDVLSTFFWMLTMWGYTRFVDRPVASKYILVVLFFILGLMSKPMLVTLPFVLLLLDYWPLKRLPIGPYQTSGNSRQDSTALRLVWEKIPLFVLAAVSSIVTFYAQKYGNAVASLDAVPLNTRINNALYSYANYIIKMLYPTKLSVLYPYSGNLPWWQTLGAFVLLLVISYVAIKALRQRPYFIIGWLWYLGTLVPVIGLVQVGSQSMADRYTYVPFIGLFIIVAWGFPDLARKLPHHKIWLGAIAAILLSTLTVITWKQVQYWQNGITLFKHTLKHTSNNFRIHNALGAELSKQGRTAEAIEHYLQALRIKSDFEKAHSNLGAALYTKGRTEEAIDHYLQALRIKPDYVDAHNNLGLALYSQGRTAEAIDHYLQALQIKPDDVNAHNNLGFTLYNQGQITKAIDHYLHALRIEPDFEKAHNNLGVALIHTGNIKGAIACFQEALRLNPEYVNAKENLKKGLMMLQQNK